MSFKEALSVLIVIMAGLVFFGLLVFLASSDLGISSVVGPGLWLAEDGRAYVNVELDFGAGEIEAIVAFELACLEPEIFSDGFESGDTSAWSSTVS